MIQSIKKSLKNNKVIVGNIFSLGTLQIFNYILPLITLPYITRVVGPENYGIVAFAGAFVAYFLIFVNYGFNLTATRDISIHREDINKVSEIFWNIICIKSLLGVIAFLVSLLLIFSFEIFSEHYLVFLFSLIAILGEMLFPSWLFQGMEKMKYITIINVIIRVLFLIPIFLLIRVADDYIWLPLIASLSSITIGVIAFFMSIKMFQIGISIPSKRSIMHQLREGGHVFFSAIAYGIYTNMPILILGLFANNTIVGTYAVAERIIRALQALIQPISQSIYPTVSQKLIISRDSTIKFLRNIALYFSIITCGIFVTLFLGANTLVNILVGVEFVDSIVIIQILSLGFITLGVHNVMGVLIMLNFGYKKEFTIIGIIEVILFILVSFPLTYYFMAEGLAVSLLITELIITTIMVFTLYKKGINLLLLKTSTGK